MPELNANIPPIECYVRGNFLRDQKDSHDKYFPVVIFGVASVQNRSPLFHFLMEDGGIWWRMHGYSESPGQHKCGHVIERDDGNFAIQPNNRVLLFEPSFSTKVGTKLIDRVVNSRKWDVEDADKWLVEDSERYDYDLQVKDKKK